MPNQQTASGRTASGRTAIRARGLRKSYRDIVAVDGIDLDVATGEIVALLGPNGAGKTTVTEILEGFRSRDAGELSVLGADPDAAGAAWRDRIGIVLQKSSDFELITVEEVLRHFARYYRNPRDVDRVLDAVGLTGKRRSRTGLLSGGQRRRLDVGLGILGNPELLFLDEPTTGFDPEARRQFWDLVGSLRDDGTTVLLTTHYLEEAEHLADRVAVVHRGRVVAADTPARLGGRQAARAAVGWTDADGPHELLVDDPTRTVLELAARFGGEVPGLTVSRPTLEDVYLSMIERDATRDATQDATEDVTEGAQR